MAANQYCFDHFCCFITCNSTFNEFIAKSRLPMEAILPTCNDNAIPIDEDTKEPSLSVNKFEPVCNEEEREFATSKEQSLFSGYDKCNI